MTTPAIERLLDALHYAGPQWGDRSPEDILSAIENAGFRVVDRDSALREASRPDGFVAVELPSTEWTLRDLTISPNAVAFMGGLFVGVVSRWVYPFLYHLVLPQ